MGFEEYFEEKRKYHGNYNVRSYHDKIRHSPDHYSNHEQFGLQKWSAIADKIRKSTKLKLLVLVAAIVILVSIIVLMMVLMPFIIKLYNYINTNGLQSVLDNISAFLDKLWKGSGK
jgi:hypothetical protein